MHRSTGTLAQKSSGAGACAAALNKHMGALLMRSLAQLCAQFVADGVFFAELNEMLTRELAEDGFSGVEVRTTPLRTEIIIRATRTQNVLGACGAIARRCACSVCLIQGLGFCARLEFSPAAPPQARRAAAFES